jgi:hypothetical protein
MNLDARTQPQEQAAARAILPFSSLVVKIKGMSSAAAART